MKRLHTSLGLSPIILAQGGGHVGNWMQTASGRQIWVLQPDMEQVVIEDIAHHLAQLSRYCGACPFPYSVSQHSRIVSWRAQELALQSGASETQAKAIGRAGLMHDAAEAYLQDIHRPLKVSLSVSDLGISFADLEEVWLRALGTRFRFQMPLPPEVMRADQEVWATEAEQLFPVRSADWGIPVSPLPDIKIVREDFEEAKEQFLRRFLELDGKP